MRCKQFVYRPDVIGNSSFHGRSHAQALVYAAKIVVSEVERTRGFQVAQLLREGICQTGEAAYRHSQTQVAPFDIRGRNVARVGPAVAYPNYRLYHR